MLNPVQIEKFYLDDNLKIPNLWNLSRKHFRLKTIDGRYIKLNRYERRISQRDLKYYCYKFRPAHVYFSVLDWLFPERVGKKTKANYCVPLNGNYVVDVDAYMILNEHGTAFSHCHKIDPEWKVCEKCLEMSKHLTLSVCEAVERYYSDLAIVFSGSRGFHVHVLDFNYRDTISFREDDPLWVHHASRYRFTSLLQRQTGVFDRWHFSVSVDPMRVVTVPNTLNAKTGLVCSYLGDRKTFEKQTVRQILEKSKSFCKYNLYRHCYPEPLESPTTGRAVLG